MPEKPAVAPWHFKAVTHVLQSCKMPSGRFDPAGSWEHTYNIHFLNIRGSSKALLRDRQPVEPNGVLKIASAPTGGAVELRVDATAIMAGDRTTAHIRCNRDALCSPTAWDLHFTNQGRESTPYVTFTKTGAVVDGTLMKDGKAAKRTKRLAAYTCDWSLFDAVQRLALGSVTSALGFDLVEYLDVVRENQVLKHRGKTQIHCAGKDVDAQEYLQYGDGVLPTQYFVDGNGRLFMVLGSRRLYVLVEEKLS